jgi:protease-4
MRNRGLPLRIISALWRGLDRLRRLLHLILLLGVALIFIAAMIGERVFVPSQAALIIAPRGALVDQLSGDPLERAIARARGAPLQETLLADVIDALRAARDDDRIKAVVLDFDGLSAAGLSKLQEVAAEIKSFRTSGKPVIAVGDSFTRDQYYLAAFADRVYLNPMGQVLIDGYGRFLPYYKSALEKLYVDYNFWTVGEYKSFVEPATRDDMSAQDREASRAYLDGLWTAYQADVTGARRMPEQALQRYADGLAELLEQAQGDSAKLALDYGLVDELLSRDEMREKIRAALGQTGPGKPHRDDFTHIGLDDYVSDVRASVEPRGRSSKIAVVVAAGTILDGNQPPGAIGGDSTAELIRRAADDEHVKALVLRVDSGGGSAFASDVILRELEAFQRTKRPVVVSMSSVAASGGYWISMAADEIWANPTTLTGSIGVGATIPTFRRLLDKVGVHVDGIGTTEIAGTFDVTRDLSPAIKAFVGESVRNTYAQFVGKVAEHRKRSFEEIDRAARGRVWTGSDALQRGLVDRLGTFSDALDSAAELAGLERDSYSVEYFERNLGLAERAALQLSTAVMPAVRGWLDVPGLPASVSRWLETAMKPIEFYDRMNDPRGVYAYCFCDTR